MKFADNLKKIRKSKNISQEELAYKVGVSRQSVSKWETSEAYPEMNNILELCKIFKRNINDLVNDNMIDLDSLGEEVKMSVVKLKKEKQKQMKGISKVLSLIGKIGAIVLRVAFVFVILTMIFIPIIFSTIDIKDGKIVSNNSIIEIVNHDNSYDLRLNKSTVLAKISNSDIDRITPSIDKFSKPVVVVIYEFGLIILGAFIICLIKVLKHVELLFDNINKGDTPFTLGNANHIKKMFYLLISCIILSSIGDIILNIPMKNEVDINFNLLNIVEILFLYSMSLVFEYGYEIQLDSKGKMYDEEN